MRFPDYSRDSAYDMWRIVVRKGKRLVRFFIIVGLLQGIFLLAGTESGLGLLFTGLVRLHAEPYSPYQSANVVYYDMRLPVSETKHIVVALDFSVRESSDAFLHFFRFVKQYNNIQTVLFAHDAYVSASDRINAVVSGEEGAEAGLSENVSLYAAGLSAIWDTMQPVRKFTVGAIAADDWQNAISADDTLVLCDRDVIMTPENRAILEANDVFLWEVKYDNCITETDNRSDIHLPFVGTETGYYMMSMDRIPHFCMYYRRALNLFDMPSLTARADRLENENAPYFCVIVNGTNRSAAVPVE